MESELRLTRAWDVIEEWLSSHAPESYASLKDPASEAEVAGLEDVTGGPLCKEFTILLRRHNGAFPAHERPTVKSAGYFLPRADRLLSAQEIREHQTMLNGVLEEEGSGHLSGTWWHREWIPFTVSNAADGLFVDHRRLNGQPGPTFGQVGRFVHDGNAKIHPFTLDELFERIAQVLMDEGTQVLGCAPVLRSDKGKLGWQFRGR